MRHVRLELNNSGSRTRRGDRWTQETIRRILSSRLYVGELLYNRRSAGTGKIRPQPEEEHIRVPDAVPAIIAKDQFERVQRILAERAPLPPRAQATGYLLSNLAKCEHCGKTLYGHTTWKERAAPKWEKGPRASGWIGRRSGR